MSFSPQNKLKIEQYIQSHDDKFQIYHHMWKESGPLKAVVFIVHGLGEHCHRYDRIIDYLTDKNVRVFSFDHRGHGRTHKLSESQTQGHKGHIDVSADVVLGDIDQLIRRADDEGVPTDIPRFLLGHSLGGLFALYYAMKRDMSRISGLISVAPSIGIVNPPNIIVKKLGSFAAKLIPFFPMTGYVRTEDLSRDPAAVDAIKNDKLVHGRISLATGVIVLDIIAELDSAAQPEISVPTMFIHGTEDKITDCKSTEEFYNKLSCPSKSLYLHRGGYHRLDPNSRYDNSLGLLTRKFVNLLKESDDGVLDLNFAATQLAVQKRRIYDITNVLEGIGLIEKTSKNNVRWKGNSSSTAESSEVLRLQRLREEVLQLKREEANLERSYESAQTVLRSMNEDENSKRLAYLTHMDIRNIPSFSEETLLAVKAPFGSTLEVPDPDEGMPPGQRRYEVQLSSKSGPIDVFLIQDPTSTATSTTKSHASQQSKSANPAYPTHQTNHALSSISSTHFHASEMLKPFEIPLDAFAFEMKSDEGAADLYGFGSNTNGDVYNVFATQQTL